MNLKELMLDCKAAWVAFPGLKGFEVEVVNLSRKELTKLRKNCTITKFDRKMKQPVESIDEERFVSDFSAATIKNWKGLTYEYLETLILVDVSGKSLDTLLPYSKENAELLISSSVEFDEFINNSVFDLENFRSPGEGELVEEA